MRTQVFAKVALYGPDGRLLFIKRSSTDKLRAGEWDLPGGGIEKGEDLAAGAAREVMEEVNIRVEPGELRLAYAATEPWQDQDSNTRLLFIGRTEETTVTLSFEHEEYRWVDTATAIAEFPHPVYSAALKYAAEHQLL